MARYRITVGTRIGSAALVADGLHARTDGFTSLAVFLSAGGVALGWHWADPVVGLAIAVTILGVLRSAVRQVLARLMDAVDPALVRQATQAIAGVEGIEATRDLRIRWIGHTLRAEADVTVDPALTVQQAHDLAHHAEDHLLADVRRLNGATIHLSPIGRSLTARRAPSNELLVDSAAVTPSEVVAVSAGPNHPSRRRNRQARPTPKTGRDLRFRGAEYPSGR